MDGASYAIDNRNVTPIGVDYFSTPGLHNREDNYVLDLRNSVVSLNNTIINAPQSNSKKVELN